MAGAQGKSCCFFDCLGASAGSAGDNVSLLRTGQHFLIQQDHRLANGPSHVGFVVHARLDYRWGMVWILVVWAPSTLSVARNLCLAPQCFADPIHTNPKEELL